MKVRSKLSRKIFALGLILFLGSGLVLGIHAISTKFSAQALSARDFNPGRIMDDSVFYNKDAMSIIQIQSFLNTLIPWCNTWNSEKFTDASGALVGSPYVCLNNYHENPTTGETSFEKGGGAFSGGHSAARIIYDAAQKYNINPQVLLVMLKKESLGPITSDNWPTKWQYRYSMGYGCPDSGPDFTAACNEKQAGFYKQVNLAAWQFDYYRKNPNSYRYKIGWNDIQYSPNPACGTKRVNIENIATLSLYIYTPYVPNDAALANYPGTSHCGAYGNRNFFMFFSEWFGSTLGDSWESIEEPRWKKMSQDLRKIDVLTGKAVGDVLETNRELYFVDKIQLRGKTYLRTAYDSEKGSSFGVDIKQLSKLTYTKITPQWKVINYDGVNKYRPDTETWYKEEGTLPIGTLVEVVDAITVDGVVSYRTRYHSERDNNSAIHSNRLDDLKTLLSLDEPREMSAISEIDQVNLSGEKCGTMYQYDPIFINSKFYFNETLYFTNDKSATNPDKICAIRAKDLNWRPIKFESFEEPRTMRLKSRADRMDLETGRVVDSLPGGMQIHFSSKVTHNGISYFRTTHNGNRNRPHAIRANLLEDL